MSSWRPSPTGRSNCSIAASTRWLFACGARSNLTPRRRASSSRWPARAIGSTVLPGGARCASRRGGRIGYPGWRRTRPDGGAAGRSLPAKRRVATAFSRQRARADEIMARAGGRRCSRCRAVRRRRVWLAVGSRAAFQGDCSGGQACKCAASLNRRPPVRKYERRRGAGLFRRRDHRRSDHRPLAFARQLRHRAGDGLHLQGKPVDAKQIGRELGVRYVLEGSVRRLGEKVEVNAELVSTETGAHVWAERFEGERQQARRVASRGRLTSRQFARGGAS